jgi:hypothetical protein
MINQGTTTRQLPPLGDISVRSLTRMLIAVWSGNPLVSELAQRNATIDDVRTEIRRRERLGVGLHS